MSDPSTDSIGIDISYSFAPIYWGFVVSLFFGGITIVQSYLYFLRSTDQLLVKVMAAAMLVFDMVDSMLVAYSIYYYLIPHFGNLTRLDVATPELSAECLIATCITTISQIYFIFQLVSAKRIGKGNWTVIGIIGAFTALAFAGGIACVVTMYMFSHGIVTNRNKAFSITFGIAKGFGTVTDVVATIAMCLFLTSARTGMKQTNSLLNALMQFILQRGALVTLVQALLLVTFYASPDNLTWMAFHINIPKLYANTFFAMLNARDHLKRKHYNVSMRLNESTTQSHARSRSKDLLSSNGERSTLVVMDTKNDKGVFSSNMPTVTTTTVISHV